LFYGSLQGLVASLNDPHSIFFPPKEAEQFNKDISGEFEGIGAEIGIKNNQLVVISPLSGSPAERAGLRAGDKILAIDKEITVGMDTFTAVTKIRGASGTPVVLSIGREKQLKPFDLKIVREKIVAPSFTYILKPNNIVYLRISQFNQDTIPLFDAALEKMPKNIKGVVVDLRNDPGGYLQVAVQVASKWIPNGDMVVEEKGRVGILGSFTSLGSQPFLGKKTVVIINKGSASASEILAGALQDYKLATIIGETSYGKGSVQDLKTFDDGSSLKLTIAEWFTPLGRNINKEGIKPDIEVKEDDAKAKTGQDAVLNKALQIITSGVEVKKVSEKK
jgi:carboxyl-terminal processing protease